MRTGHIGQRRSERAGPGGRAVPRCGSGRCRIGVRSIGNARMGDRYDVLVIGGGPSGAAAAYWLAQRGRRVLVVEKKRFPREKTCGDGLTPRAVRELHDMGLAEPLADYLRYDGLRSIAHGVTLELGWPDHPDFPSYGYVIRRRDLDEMVAGRAVKAGATHWPATEAVAPIVDGGLVTGAVVHRK